MRRAVDSPQVGSRWGNHTLCFTALVNDGGFCCSTEICVTIPDCTPVVKPSDLNGDVLDLLILLGNWG